MNVNRCEVKKGSVYTGAARNPSASSRIQAGATLSGEMAGACVIWHVRTWGKQDLAVVCVSPKATSITALSKDSNFGFLELPKNNCRKPVKAMAVP